MNKRMKICGFLGVLTSLFVFNNPAIADYPIVKVEREIKISELSPRFSEFTEDLEASGVFHDGNYFFVVFDNKKKKIAKIHHSLAVPSRRHKFTELDYPVQIKQYQDGYEGFTHSKDMAYALLESFGRHGAIVEYPLSNMWNAKVKGELKLLNLGNQVFEDPESKGFEGLSYFEHNGNQYLFALCEGNKCKKSKSTNDGIIRVFKRVGGEWVKQRKSILLKGIVSFQDYAGLSIDKDGRVAIVSQMDSRLWVGKLKVGKGGFSLLQGKTYNFPRASRVRCDGKTYNVPAPHILYTNIEGVDWISPTQLVTVTDRRKKRHKSKNDKFRCKDQSIQVISLSQ